MNRRRSAERASLLATPLALVIASCSSAATTEPQASSSAPIVGGTASDDSQNAVVLLFDRKQSFECTATVIAPKVVLTARHCVADVSDDVIECDDQGNTLKGTFGADYPPSDLAVFVGSSRSTVFPPPTARGVAIYHDGATGLCGHDLAVVELDTPLDAPVAPLRLDAGPVAGETFTVVGWGTSTTTQIVPARAQRTSVPLLSTGPTTYEGLAVPPNDFLVGESICNGDSGSPAFASTTGAVVGVAANGSNGQTPSTTDPAATCVDQGQGVLNTFTSLSAFKAVFDAAFASVGGAPTVDDATPPAVTPPASTSGGCSASPGKTNAPGPIAWLAIALGALLVRRRRG